MLDTVKIRSVLSATCLGANADKWIERSEEILSQRPHGDREKWKAAIEDLPGISVSGFDLSTGCVMVYGNMDTDPGELQKLENSLMQLHPWRKGPFNLFGLEIDSEWRSDLKWERIQEHIASLAGRHVLDVGCGNGYYLLRMLGAGAKLAMGIDPTQLFMAQFEAITPSLPPPPPPPPPP
ncbi:MAG: DUF1698 domain-containing protein, partial [bacterium]